MNIRTNRHRKIGLALPALVTAMALMSAAVVVWRGTAPAAPSRAASSGNSGVSSDAPSTNPSTSPSALDKERQQEREDVMQFFEQHTPGRFRAFRAVRNRPAGEMLLQKMTERYRRLMRLQSEDTALYSIMVKQMEIQDEAFLMIRRQQVDPNAEELRSKVREMVDLSLEEREKRIERLEKMLAEQKASLEQDRKNPDALVDKHIKQMFENAKGLDKLMPRGRGGR